MARTLEEYLKENPTVKISDADRALGRNNFGALEGILEARQKWSQATTQEERDAAHQTAENIRKTYGNYSGGADGMKGQYSPTYVKPAATAENSNVDALFDKFNNAYKNAAPTWTPQYEKQIGRILSNITNRDAFSYDMNEDSLYQQYRDQYIREGQRAMKDTMAQTAALSGGYANTAGAIAAQQGYDNYLAQLNDRVPQLEQQAYGRYADELADMYNQLGAYQSEENRLYGQYLDALGQHNADRDFAFNAMQAAVGQNNYENEINRGIYENDRDYNLTEKQTMIENALATGDYSALKELGYDTTYLDLLQAVDEAQGKYTLAQLAAKQSGSGGTSSGKSGGDNNKTEKKTTPHNVPLEGYMTLKRLYALHGDTPIFDKLVDVQIASGNITEEEYYKFEADKKAGRV